MELTRQQIEQMPAGREMDGLIAERLFGYKRSAYGGLTVFETPEYQRRAAAGETLHALGNLATLEDVPGGRDAVLRGYKHKLPFSRCIDFYSTDITTAFQLFGKGWLLYNNPDNDMNPWAVFANPLDIEDWCFLGIADTAPLAICRAALLVLLPG